jgi:transcriptional regulator with XRE-family HTH domain
MAGRPHAPTVRLRRVAAELRALRESAALTREAVAERTGINTVTLYRIENARVRPQARTLMSLLDLYGVADDRKAELTAMLRDARQRGWLQAYESLLPQQYTAYIGFEAEASAVWAYESLFVPGLLQTEDYARAVTRAGLPGASADEIDRRVEVRMQRQAVLTGSSPLGLWSIVDEAALRRQVGGPGIMRAQLDHLLEAASRPNITLQVIPYSAGAHAGMLGSFAIMQFGDETTPDETAPDVIYLDSMAGNLFLESEVEIRRYRLVFEHLRADALSPDGSRVHVAAIRDEMHATKGRRDE